MCGSFRLATEALSHLLFLRQLRVQDLDDQRSAQSHVLGVVDVRHAAAAQSPDDAVAITSHPSELGDLRVRRLAGGRG